MKGMRGQGRMVALAAGAALAVTGATHGFRRKRNLPPESGTRMVGSRPWMAEWAVIQANTEIEDRYFIEEHNGAVLCGVFDGHYGPRTAEYCRRNAPTIFSAAMKEQQGDETASLKQTFRLLEEGWTSEARKLMLVKDFKVAREGACGIMAYVTEEKVVVGNVGDSRAVLYREARKPRNTLEPLQLTREHNAADPRERIQLIRAKPNDPEAVSYNSHSGAWYVKDTLQVTRAIGDLFLKLAEFHAPLPKDMQTHGSVYEPPYVSWEAEVTSMELDEDDLFLVLASDGLWDELSNSETAESIRRASRDPASSVAGRAVAKQAFKRSGQALQAGRAGGAAADGTAPVHTGEALLWDALRANPYSRYYGVEKTLQLEVGEGRRDVHDDISILVVSLQGAAASTQQ